MVGRGAQCVVDLDRDRLTVLWGTAHEGKAVIHGVFSAVRPDQVPLESAAAVGEWIGGLLRKTSAPCSRVVLSMPRGDVVLKRLSLPGGGTSDADIGGMVRLQMTRQLTMPMEGTAVDYVQLPPSSAAAPPAGPPTASAANEAVPSTSVMAAALPADRMKWCRDLTEAGELELRRIGLRCYGAAALLAERSQRRAGPVLGMTIGWCSVEFVVVENGSLAFARAVDLTRPAAAEDAEAFAEKIAVEAKRTWMSHRATHGSPEVEIVSVIGGGPFARAAAEKSAAQLGCAHELVGLPPNVAVADEPGRRGDGTDIGELLPLVGLLMDPASGVPTLDFANPRRAPDLGRARRTRVLLGVLGAILLAGGGYVASLQSLSSLESKVRASREREATLKKEYDEFLVKHARASHVDQWASARVDWVAYLALLTEQLPPPESAVMDGLGAHMSAEVVFMPKSSSYPDGTWLTRQAAAFSLDGKMSQRAVAAELRGRLLDLNFDNVESKGPDIPDHFSFVVTTSQRAPGASSSAPENGKPAVPSPGPGKPASPPSNAPTKPAEKGGGR